MDGVTDAAFRALVDSTGHPDILFTEFTSVEGLHHGGVKLLNPLIRHKTTTPILGQIFGYTPEAFYKAAFIVSEMGLDGIDINMGCPDRDVAKKGGGAALIKTPSFAQEIIQKTKQGASDWAQGKTLQEAGVREHICTWIHTYREKNALELSERKPLPVSVKTRLGFDKIVTHEWISTLLKMEPAAISLHGRTLRQLYSGFANWDEIGRAAELAHQTNTLLLGNGDIQNKRDAEEKVKQYHVDGVLIGRAAFGNPWVFTNEEVSVQTRLKTALAHCELFEKLTPDLHFLSLRKHLAWYTKGFDGSAEVRDRLMKTKNIEEVRNIINDV
ncbi:tRNA-dihydrouridine synthase [Candidatus Roizmanbacteria bacterium]|nr:tRNA-dihydrouridine synthase [Candidatus Roizmanbacteria bacterium]